MKRLTNDQINFIAIIEKSLHKLEPLQREARRTNLLILERELLYLSKGLRDALDMQCRAFRDDSLTDPLPLLAAYYPYGSSKIP